METLGSKIELENLLSLPIRYFAYPYGTRPDVTPDVVTAIKEAGYELALTSIHGKNHRDADPLQLARIKVEHTDSIAMFKEMLLGGMDRWAWIDRYSAWLQSPRKVQIDGVGISGQDHRN
jgi:hypothetical protein